ncbi:hypothetical protein L6164_000764 [Bauhinia variegata]|uniref:Uncharacterized protein n=1 Tax=Bauhinia variegata TaxID=167791 RepID=A0ACB9Q736_BAUVA|nr:hypothetical protein L6164_000764 [Bauhinia variegata]
MFEDVETLEDARNRVHRLTDELKDKSLSMEDGKRRVTIHDLVREAAASLATQNQTAFYWKENTKVKTWPERNHLHKCKQILLNRCYMPSLPEKLECPVLQLLVLDNAGSYQQMPDSFLDKTRNLISLGYRWHGLYSKTTNKPWFLEKPYCVILVYMQLGRYSNDELNGVKDVLHDLHGNGFPRLNHLTVQNNGKIESIATSSGSPLCAFPNLEILSLCNLSNLEHICHDSLTQESFSKLRVIRVRTCHRLKCLLTSSMSKALASLAEIEVTLCDLLETLVVSEGAEYSKLRSLTMEWLPALISFSSGDAEQIDEGDNPSSFLRAPLFNEKGNMDIITSIAQIIAQYTVAPVARQVGYLIFFGRNMKNLKTRVDELLKAKERVEHDINEATRNAHEIEADVKDWFKQVDETVEEAKMIYGDEGKGSCLHLLQRHQIGRKASKMAQEITKIQTQGKFDRVGYPATPQALRIADSVKDYMALESRTNIINEIMETLQDSSIHTIAVWGTGGVGKTTLAKEVRRQAKEKNLFGAVIMTTITDKPNVEEVQKEIADSLGMTFNVSSERGRADALKQRIKKEKSILVIVDDIWEGYELERFGIPLGNEHKRCKLLLTSRNLDVLKSEMRIHKDFDLEVLEEDEVGSLFINMVGDVMEDPHKQAIATKIVKLCVNLLILIVTVTKTLKNKELYAWKDALQKVYSAVELSYNSLESEEIKSLFLLIALAGMSHFYKYDLLIHCVGQGMFRDVETLEDARNRLHTLTNQLKEKSLLIEDGKIGVVIHDLVREGAVSLATQDQTAFTTKLYSELKEWPERDRLHKCKQIFINWCYLPPLPEKLESPELQLLILDSAFFYLQRPDSFFDETRNLKDLEIGGIDWTPKPLTNLGFLKKLTVLYLFKGKLEDITIVGGELTNLQILSLSRSIIRELPREIGKLRKLKLLDLDGWRNLEVIPRNAISKLTSLEELYMGNGFVNWDVKVEGKTNASLNELEELKHHLRAIDLNIPNAEVCRRTCSLKNYNRSGFLLEMRGYGIKIFINPLMSPKH